jgi:hypothetical protein
MASAQNLSNVILTPKPTEWLDATAGHMVSSSLKNVPMLSGVPDDKLSTVAKLFELQVGIFFEITCILVSNMYFIFRAEEIFVWGSSSFSFPSHFKQQRCNPIFFSLGS